MQLLLQLGDLFVVLRPLSVEVIEAQAVGPVDELAKRRLAGLRDLALELRQLTAEQRRAR